MTDILQCFLALPRKTALEVATIATSYIFKVLHSRAIHGKIANLQLHARISNPRWALTLWGLAGITNSLF